MTEKISGIPTSSLYQINFLNNNLFNQVRKISSGKNISQASDDPSGYYSSKLINQDIVLNEIESQKIEREKNDSLSKMSKMDGVSNLISEILSLSKDITVSNKINLNSNDQNQILSLIENLKDTIKNGNLSSLKNLSNDINKIILKNKDSELNNTDTKLEKLFEEVISNNTVEGSKFNSLNRNYETLQPIINNLKSSLSTISDADLVNESINLNNQTMMKNFAMQGFKKATEIAKSTIDIFG